MVFILFPSLCRDRVTLEEKWRKCPVQNSAENPGVQLARKDEKGSEI